MKKYLKRERGKSLPKGADFWDFDCRMGVDEESSEAVHVYDINKAIDHAESKQLESFYLEILAKPGKQKKKPREEHAVKKDDS